MGAKTECRLLSVEANRFADIIKSFQPPTWRLLQRYAKAFLQMLLHVEEDELTDLVCLDSQADDFITDLMEMTSSDFGPRNGDRAHQGFRLSERPQGAKGSTHSSNPRAKSSIQSSSIKFADEAPEEQFSLTASRATPNEENTAVIAF